MKKICLLIMLMTFLGLQSQEILDNNSILSMVEMEFDDALIIDKIENSENTFDTSISVLSELKKKGVSQSILSAMVKSSKKEVLEADVEPLNNLEYTFKDGAKSYTVHLAKDEYYKELDGLMLNSVITSAMFGAKTELKNKSTYNPTFINLIRDAKKNENIISILGTAQNDYGATKDTQYKQNFQYNSNMHSGSGLFLVNDVEFNEIEFKKLESNLLSVNFRGDKSNKHFDYKYISLNGVKNKSKGEVFIGSDYVVITSEPIYGINSPDIKFPVFKVSVNENEWRFKLTTKDIVSIVTYNSVPNKYNSSGGVLTMETMAGEMVYYLIKK